MHKVTRPVSSTCLDHVYTTHPGFVTEISVPDIGLSDHLPVFIRRKYSRKQRNQTHSTIEYRDFKNLNTNELLHDLQCAPCPTVQKPSSIPYKELFPIIVAASLWGSQWVARQVEFLCDNELVVAESHVITALFVHAGDSYSGALSVFRVLCRRGLSSTL